MAKLLVVEDQPRLLRSLQRGLEEEGHTVLVASNGQSAYRCASSEPVDAVVLDLMLPGRDGLSLLRDLRREGFTRPVLIVTARDGVDDRVTGLDSGADDYLVKPFAFSELLARLRALLRRDRTAGELRLCAGDLELDRLTRRATRAGIDLGLTNRQFELLEYLVRHVNETVSREMIVREVWKDESGIFTNVVDVCVNHLRRRLERPEWPPMLLTVRGVGYELRDTACRA